MSLLNLLKDEESILNRIYNAECDIHDYKRESISHAEEDNNLQQQYKKLNETRNNIKRYL